MARPGWLALGAALLVAAGGGWLAFSYTPLWNPEQSAQISAARDSACQRSVTLRLGDNSFLAKSDQVCSWLHPVPQPTKQLSPQPLPSPQFNVDAITQWVHSCISQVEKPATNGSRQVDSAGHLVSLLKDPVDGTAVDMTGVGFDGPYSEPANYIQYFHKGFALHPAPWRTSFVYTPDTGSHGCVNMRPDDAKWLWDWADTNTTVVSHP